jgi:predicted ABC-type ATPase
MSAPRTQRGIPRHKLYNEGVFSATYEMRHIILAFGYENVLDMVEVINDDLIAKRIKTLDDRRVVHSKTRARLNKQLERMGKRRVS